MQHITTTSAQAVRMMARVALLTVACTLFGVAAYATEGGGNSSPNGPEGIMAGALPPPGFYYLNYLTHYSADQLNDKNGNKIPVDFHLTATANVSRFLYMSGYKILGADHGAYVVVPLVNVSATLNGTPAGPLSGTRSGLGDIAFNPCVLAWHGKNWHTAVGTEFIAPTGQYDKNKLANPGRNYWTIEPIFVGTVMSDNGLELSAKVMYDFNTENTATKYTSGQEFHFDYATTYHIGPWTTGATGYFYKQVSNDHGDGAAANDGNKGQVFAVGPTIKYDYKNMSLEVKYQKEMLAENRPEGDKYWVKLIWAF